MAFLNQEQLTNLHLKHIGKNVKISERAVFYGNERISIGDNTRIDDFCIISAGEEGIIIGSFVHIAAYCSLQGNSLITLEDFSGLSSRVAIYSSSDDYSGGAMTNPCIPNKYTNVISSPVKIKKHSIIGVGSCILPNVVIGLGSAIGAFSLVNKDIDDHVIAVGVPVRYKAERKKDLFELEKSFISSLVENGLSS